jgi:dipeptidyl aminopeptidase/acylaminoacyl peptidase
MALLPSSNIAISPDGKRVVIIRSAQGQQILTFTTARPNDLTMVLDLAGTGERATNIVWAGDGSDSILFAAVKDTGSSSGESFGGQGAWAYSVLRSVDLATRDVREVGRIDGLNSSGVSIRLWPLAWLPARQVAAALEMPQRGTVFNYVLARNGNVERTAMNPTQANIASFSASRDGRRIVVSAMTSIRWWPVDQPSAVTELQSQPGELLGHAEFRPGADEIGVHVPEGGRFEIWTLTGQRRVVATAVGAFVHWRVDGSAAIASSDPYTAVLIDPATGATTPLPGVGALSDVVMF